MGIISKTLDAIDKLNEHETDTWQICPHCNQRVHITKCRMPKINTEEAQHYESLEGVSKRIVKETLKISGANDLLAKGMAKYLSPKAQRGIEEATHVIRSSFNNLHKRETVCPKCKHVFTYLSDNIINW